MKMFIVCFLIAIPLIGPEIVSLAGSALATGGTILIPVSLAGLFLVKSKK